jgi:hypothetical protein
MPLELTSADFWITLLTLIRRLVTLAKFWDISRDLRWARSSVERAIGRISLSKQLGKFAAPWRSAMYATTSKWMQPRTSSLMNVVGQSQSGCNLSHWMRLCANGVDQPKEDAQPAA